MTENPYEAPSAHVEEVFADGELALAGRGRRLAGVLIDFLFFLVCIIPAIVVAASQAGSTADFEAIQASPQYTGTFALGALVAVGVQAYFLWRRSQSVGKIALGTKILRTDGSDAGFVRTFWLRMFLNGILQSLPLIGALYGLADGLAIFRDSRKCIHDNIADTIVVKL